MHGTLGYWRTSRRQRSLLLAGVVSALALAGTGCADGHDGGLGVPAPGEPAAIVYAGVSWAGGQVYREEVRVDSATMRFRHRWCYGGSVGRDCSLDEHVETGEAYRPSALELFRLANSSAFRSLRSEYTSPSGGVLSPDPSSAWFDVTANGRYRRVTWSEGAQLPPVLQEMSCMMLSARGSLILCD